MPQMMPLNWLSLMIYFFLILYMFNCMNFYLFNYYKSFKIFKNKSNNIWKW